MSGGQLMLEAVLTDILMADIDVEGGDAELERLLAAARAAGSPPRPCRCERGPLLLDEGDYEARCWRCGRRPAA